MSVNDDLKEFFSGDVDSVVEDSEKFRRKLNIGADAFKYLKKAENLGSFVQILSAGGLAALGANTAWLSSLGVLGTIGLKISLVSTPIGWVALAGLAGSALVYGAKKTYGTVRNESITEVPKFINSPIDVLAVSITGLIIPILLKISHADKDYSQDERTAIINYFVAEWGLNHRYVEDILKSHEEELADFNYSEIESKIDLIVKTGDMKREVLLAELLKVCDDVMASDGVICEHEKSELDKLRNSIKKN